MLPDDFIQKLIVKHRESGILIDSNLLLLFIVGTFDRR